MISVACSTDVNGILKHGKRTVTMELDWNLTLTVRIEM